MRQTIIRKRRFLGFMVVLCGLSLPGFQCLIDCPLLPSSGASDDSVSVQMVAAAKAELEQTHANVTIIWAGGHQGDGQPMQAPADTKAWDFLALTVDPDGTGVWLMHYDGTWTVTPLEHEPLGIEYTSMSVVTMDVVEAWGLALAAGYQPPFNSWELFKPLNPNVPNIIYVFNMIDGSHVIVDTVTGQVTQERDAWDCYQQCREAYIDCCDSCRENAPGDPDCYDQCDQDRNECDNDCGS